MGEPISTTNLREEISSSLSLISGLLFIATRKLGMMRRLVTLRSEMFLTTDEEITVIRYEDGQILERVVDTCSRLLDRLRYRHVAERCRCTFMV